MNVYVFKRHSLVICLICAIVLGGIMFVPDIGSVFKSGSRNLPVYSVARSDNKIALTFNCAWGDSDIDNILSSLDKYSAKATFFIVGEWAEKFPDKVKKIKDAGHELGGHSYNHKDYTTLSQKQVEEDILRTVEVIEKASGVRIKLIRVPSGAYNSDVISAIERLNCIPVQWSVDTIDYGDADCESIFKRATEKTVAGDIILMHTGTENTAVALPRILDSLSGNYEFSVVSELLYEENFYVGNDGKMKKDQ